MAAINPNITFTSRKPEAEAALHSDGPQTSPEDESIEQYWNTYDAIMTLLDDNLLPDNESRAHTETKTIPSYEATSFEHSQYFRLDENESEQTCFVTSDSIRTSFEGEERTETQVKQAGRRTHDDRIEGWKPSLRNKSTIAAFAVCLGSILIGLETVFVLSRLREGLGDADSRLQYLWSYGTTGLFALVAAFWGRLDYEVKAAAPWFNINSGTAIPTAFSLDYIDTWSILVPFQSLRNRDYMVASSSLTVLLLRMLTILSTGIFSSKSLLVTDHPEHIILTSKFVDNSTSLTNFTSQIPPILMRATYPSEVDLAGEYLSGLGSVHIEYPQGVSNQFAYSTFESQLSGTYELRATVDGITIGFECEKASLLDFTLGQMFAYEDDSIPGIGGTLIELEHEGCQMNMNLTLYMEGNGTGTTYTMAVSPGTFARNECNSPNMDAKRIIIFSAEIGYEFKNRTSNPPTGGTINTDTLFYDLLSLRSTVLSCAPYYNLTSVDVIRNASGVDMVISHPSAPSTVLPNVHPWEIIQACLDSYSLSDFRSMQWLTIGDIDVGGDEDTLFWPILERCGEACANLSAILDESLLTDLLTQYYQTYSALVLAQAMTTKINESTTAWSARNIDRLVVEPFPSQLMAAMLVIAIIAIVYVGGSEKDLMSQTIKVSPGSILATAILAEKRCLGRSGSGSTYDTPREDVASDSSKKSTQTNTSKTAQENVRSRREQENPKKTAIRPNDISFQMVQPFTLRIPTRMMTCLFLIGSAITLEVMLWRSSWDHGIGDAWDSRYLSLAWTAVPAGLLAALALVLSSIDNQSRILSPYLNLKHDTSMNRPLKLDLLRGWLPTILLREISSKSYIALSTSIAALLGSFLTTASAPLFNVRYTAVSEPWSLRPASFFTPNMTQYDEASALASLILGGNISYPVSTFADLVFPNFTNEAFSDNMTTRDIDSGSIVTAVLPALRSRLICHKYAETEVNSMYQDAVEVAQNIGPGIAINISSDESLHQDSWEPFPNTASFGTGDVTAGYFGGTYLNYDISGRNILVESYKHFLFVYGHFDFPKINTTALGCNATLELVDAIVSFKGDDLQIDDANPPRVVESTVRDSIPFPQSDTGWVSGLYSDLASLPTPRGTVFDPFFQQLVTSRFAIPVSSFNDPDQAQQIEDAIVFQHCIIAAQAIARFYRENSTGFDTSNITASNMSPPLFGETKLDSQNGYPAKITNPNGRRRVMQDPIATRLLEALLLTMLLFSTVAWCLSPREPLLSSSPTTIRAVLALLRDGDVLEYLYPPGKPEPTSLKNAAARFGKDCEFRLGWGPSTDDQDGTRQRYGIWVVKND